MSEPIWKINGKVVAKKDFNKGNKWNGDDVPRRRAPQTYQADNPLVSESLGCMPGQVKEYRESIKEAGITGVNVRDNGQAVITSKGGRNGLLKLHNKHDLDGGYGDH